MCTLCAEPLTILPRAALSALASCEQHVASVIFFLVFFDPYLTTDSIELL